MHALNRKDAVVNFVDVSFVLDVRREGRMVGTPWAPVRVDPVTIHNMILQLLRVGKVFTTHDANVQLLVKSPVMAHKFALGFEGLVADTAPQLVNLVQMVSFVVQSHVGNFVKMLAANFANMSHLTPCKSFVPSQVIFKSCLVRISFDALGTLKLQRVPFSLLRKCPGRR